MAKKEYFDGKLAWFFKMAGCISVNRSIKDETAKKQALNVLEENGAIGLFPEGTRNKTKDFLLPFKFGAVSMAQKTNATIVPFGLTGDYKFRSKNLTVRFGKPFKVGDMTLEEANKKLYNEIGKLMKENLKQEKKNRK
jgi:1-acyl-sn-glycerol-3-phosphate acyltransferase